MSKNLIIAIPKGRILSELNVLFAKIGFVPESDFYDDKSRKLIFDSNFENLKIIKVRSFDVATIVKFGGADFGVCGLDVLEEFSSPDIHPLFDLGVGKCRLSIAAKKDDSLIGDFSQISHLRIATKYLNLTNGYFSSRGVQAECIKLNGAMELAPHLNLCDYIVDLVSTGNTLRENGLVEIKKVLDVSSYFIVNRHSLKTKNQQLLQFIKLFDINKIIKD
ncbi:MAG: ATP phosphoribosyltransferase [Myxococcota bacterium]|jgi:ATP phosphoribosyltransferase